MSKPRRQDQPRGVIAKANKDDLHANRARLGSLSQLQVSTFTGKRYTAALDRLWAWMAEEGRCIPPLVADMDALVACFIEHPWEDGEGLSLAKDTLSGLQWAEPSYKHHLQRSWGRCMGSHGASRQGTVYAGPRVIRHD